jgi:hypothetical protein
LYYLIIFVVPLHFVTIKSYFYVICITGAFEKYETISWSIRRRRGRGREREREREREIEREGKHV